MNAFRQRRSKVDNGYDILPPDAMGSRPARRSLSQSSVEDAHFITLPVDPTSRAPHRFENDNRIRQSPRPSRSSGQMGKRSGEMARGIVSRIETYLMRMSADFFSAIVAFVFVMVFGLAGGFSLINSGQQAPSKGLDITHVTLAPQEAGGMPVLQINGIVENRTGALQKVNPIRAELIVDDRIVFSTIIDPPVTHIQQDHSRGFVARVPHPGGKRPQLRLSFIEAGATTS
ncbi:hypothetical protein ACFSE1_06670 [Rhizobium helianthi]|uniref:DUF3426 domain-containing protein n=1 Tax=Rhizobium helianthi TaxID=1132695 RepID=A0ABW4M3Q1_9HYPH